jgi:hypothetical protein
MLLLFRWNWKSLVIHVDGQLQNHAEDGLLLAIRNAGKLSYMRPDGS